MKQLKLLLLLLSLAGYGSAQQVKNHSEEPGWEIRVTERENYTGVALSNGRIGLMPSDVPFTTNAIYLNNVYDKESPLGDTRLLKGINFANTRLSIDGEVITGDNISAWTQTLNMKEAWMSTTFKFRNKAEVTCRVYALRQMPYAALMDLTVKALNGPIELQAEGIINCPVEYKPDTSAFRILKDAEIVMPLLETVAWSPSGKYRLAASASFLFNETEHTPELSSTILERKQTSLLTPTTDQPENTPSQTPATNQPGTSIASFTKRLAAREEYNFAWAGAVCTSKDFNDPQAESERMVIYLLREKKEKIVERHQQEWAALWESDIIIEGDPVSQQDIRLALYHLYAFSCEGSRLSIPPMGLSSQNYNGHIFWDSEIWMFPPLLVFHPEMARSMLDYRYDRLAKARQKAVNFGYKGAMFPWESDDTGEEATPPWALTGTFEHHITADVGIAFWNYYRVTGNLSWLRETGYPVLKEVADFWVSRAERNQDGSWSIRNVVGADEFAPNVDDNAFTNGSAKVVLYYAGLAAAELGIAPSPRWKEVADHLSFHFFENGVMKEHSRYNGERIKQADVNLLAYPLELVTAEDRVRQDLEYYQSKIAPEGPAMGLSILSILYSRLGDNQKAFELFKKSYEPNKRPPFGALSETAVQNYPYFTTGAGGMLQAVLFGFAGLHFTEDGLISKDPCLPGEWKSLTIKRFGKNPIRIERP